MKRIAVIAVALAVVLGIGAIAIGIKGPGVPRAGAEGLHAAATSARASRFHCPMHPTYTSDKPGDCPICGMKLVPIQEEGTQTGAAPAGADRKIAYYRSPMNPNVHSDKPAKLTFRRSRSCFSRIYLLMRLRLARLGPRTVQAVSSSRSVSSLRIC